MKKFPTVLKSFKYYSNRIFARILKKDEIKKLQLFMREHSDYMIKAKYRFDLLGGKSSFVICYDNLSNSLFMRFKHLWLNFAYPKISILKTREITKGIKVMLLHDKQSFKIFDETNNYVY